MSFVVSAFVVLLVNLGDVMSIWVWELVSSGLRLVVVSIVFIGIVTMLFWSVLRMLVVRLVWLVIMNIMCFLWWMLSVVRLVVILVVRVCSSV